MAQFVGEVRRASAAAKDRGNTVTVAVCSLSYSPLSQILALFCSACDTLLLLHCYLNNIHRRTQEPRQDACYCRSTQDECAHADGACRGRGRQRHAYDSYHEAAVGRAAPRRRTPDAPSRRRHQLRL
jgi:hypothetical protein